jgi:hypothetical protein
MQEEMPLAQMAAVCTQGEDLSWFTVVHPLPSDCTAAARFAGWDNSGRYALDGDIDGNGEIEYLIFDHSTSVIDGGIAGTGCLVTLNEVAVAGSNSTVTDYCVLRSETVAAFVFQHHPAATSARVVTAGLRDVDHDGDLDLLARIISDQFDWVWVENTGFQHTNRVAADINRDGRVDGADLCLVLASWEATP